MSGHFSRTIYVGNLPSDIREWEVEDLFYRYGHILDIKLKIPAPLCIVLWRMLKKQSGVVMDTTLMDVVLGLNLPMVAEGSLLQVIVVIVVIAMDLVGGRYAVSRHSEYRVIVHGLPN